MADTDVVCNQGCGCPVPCPGNTACRCRVTSSSGAGGDVHKKCSCGEHCGCNPCSCSKGLDTVGVGKSKCKCGSACNCPTCAS
ncbi:Class II metallothionein-like protein 1A [Euphorbia peplus]|nr:Class II metallothionein-like protein 1A [Euphorbia peplus]